MSAYGVTPAGFVLPSLVQILADLKASVLATIDPGLDVSDDQPLGQLLGIIAAREMTLWELLQVGYNATNRGDAEGAQLDNVGDITGTKRLGETPCTVACTAMFSQAGTFAKGTLFAYVAGASSQQWANQQDLTIPSTSNDGSGDPIGPTHLYTVANALWQSTTDGPIWGDALNAANFLISGFGSLNQLVPVAGWHSIADTGSVTLGTLEEDDPPYRVRQRQDLSAPGSATLDAIGASILVALEGQSISPPPSVQMYENTGLATDGNGLPGKSFMAVVFDGTSSPQQAIDNAFIAGAIWDNKPAGIQDYGTTTVSITDSLGIARSVSFTRSTAVRVQLSVTAAVSASMPSGQRTALRATIATSLASAAQGSPFPLYGTTFTPAAGAPTTLIPGQDVVANSLKSIVQGQTGVIDVPVFTITSPGTTPDGNVEIDIAHVGTLAATDVTVTIVTFNPAS